MTPEQAVQNLWAICMEASLPLKNYEVVIKCKEVLEEALKNEKD